VGFGVGINIFFPKFLKPFHQLPSLLPVDGDSTLFEEPENFLFFLPEPRIIGAVVKSRGL
jgi:hypothetical protein